MLQCVPEKLLKSRCQLHGGLEPSLKLSLLYFVTGNEQAPVEGAMTTTKAAYLIAVFVPFGFVALAMIALTHTMIQRRKAKAIAARAAAAPFAS